MSFELIVGGGIISFICIFLFINLFNSNRNFTENSMSLTVIMLGLLLFSLLGLYGVSRGLVDSDYQCDWLLQESITNGSEVSNVWSYTCLPSPDSGTSISIFRGMMFFISLISMGIILILLRLLWSVLIKTVRSLKRK